MTNCKTLLTGINELCRPFDIPDGNWRGLPAITFELIESNGTSADLYCQAFPVEVFQPFADFIKQAFGIELSMPEIKETAAPAPKVEKTALNVEKVVRANCFELIDEDGNLAAEMRTMRGIMGKGRRTIFSMKGNECRSIQMVSDTDTDEMAFRILESGSHYPVSLGLNINAFDTHPTLQIGDPDNHKTGYVRLTVEDDLQSPALRLYDRKDKIRAVLKVLADGTPVFETHEPKRKEVKQDERN